MMHNLTGKPEKCNFKWHCFFCMWCGQLFKKLIMPSVDECHGSYINWNGIFRKNLCIVYQNWNVYALWSRNSTSRNTSFRNIYTWAHKFLYKNVCCSTVCNGEKQQTSYVSYSRLRNCNPATQSGRNLAIKKKQKRGSLILLTQISSKHC